MYKLIQDFKLALMFAKQGTNIKEVLVAGSYSLCEIALRMSKQVQKPEGLEPEKWNECCIQCAAEFQRKYVSECFDDFSGEKEGEFFRTWLSIHKMDIWKQIVSELENSKTSLKSAIAI